MIEPDGLVERVGVYGFTDERKLGVEERAACFRVCVALAKDVGNELAPVVPSGEVGEISLDHLGRVLKLRFCETLWRRFGCRFNCCGS